MKMILTIDIGNTKIKFGIFKKTKLVDFFHCNSNIEISSKIDEITQYSIDTVIISSVAPRITSLYKKYINKILQISPFIINYQNCNISLNVEEPSSVGSDRICNISGALKLYKYPAIIIDFGTATTFDVINNKKEFIGGAIVPGVETSAEYLMQKAELLNMENLSFPQNVIGKNTKTNLQSGIMFGAIDQVNGMIERINNETQCDNEIILTGGFSKILSTNLAIKHMLDINLTLKGMIYIYESNS